MIANPATTQDSVAPLLATPEGGSNEQSWLMKTGALTRSGSFDSNGSNDTPDLFLKKDLCEATERTLETLSSSSCCDASDDEQADASPDTAVTGNKRRSSIKRSCLIQEIPVTTRRGSWRALPKPDMDKIRRTVSAPLCCDSTTDGSSLSCEFHNERSAPRRRSSSVTFVDVHIRSYSQTIGDNPSVSYGPPIQLDWKFEEHKPIPVDDFEAHRGERRSLKQMTLNYFVRMNLLENVMGHSKEELKAAQRAASRDKLKRAVTKYFLPVQMLEDVAESSVRKTKRALSLKRQGAV